ncbi:MAG TPA: multidrug efflux RND transporter permease subunit [Candidatus Acidoferrales bacterium]|nr:multidrug efflux RND transporter permease subunit [Candidatus Acidoferrales bacterium]
MNISADFSVPFIKRPVATTLLTMAIFLAGALAFNFLPQAPLPQVDFPTISVNANLPGASPETMASSVATPLERQFGRISGVTQMTSSSALGGANITLQFDLSRNIDAAGRDVQAAINAARSQLPANLPGNPTYRKINPADAPILLLGLTSKNISRGDVYDAADSILAQKISQIEGVGQVFVWGGAQPAVRVDVNPTQISSYGISLEQVRQSLSTANAHSPVGSVEDGSRMVRFETTDQLFLAKEYRSLIIAWQNGAPIRLSDIATVTNSVSNTRNDGISNGSPAIMIAIFRQAGANIIDTVDHVRAELPSLQASIPPSIHLGVIQDRSPTIRASVHDVEITLLISIILVVLVVFAFLRNAWATMIPSISVPLSLVGTFGVMYLLGYSIDNLSLMALTVSTGFVVDDAIVVIENISRHLEAGMKPFEAALQGAREIGFTVFSMSTSLIAVFIPILLMGGIVGRLFREFAVTLSSAIAVSLLVSLTTTPMMCARFLRREHGQHGLAYRIAEKSFNRLVRTYDRCLRWVLQNQPAVLAITLMTVALSVYLFWIAPKGFFPQQDTGRLSGSIVADQATSFAAMDAKMIAFEKIVESDPAVDTVTAFTGGSSENTARMFAQLKDPSERKVTSDQVIARLRKKLAVIPGATLYLQSVQDVSVGGRGSNSQYQFTLQSENLTDLYHWAPLLLTQLQKIPELRDVNSDQQVHGLEENLVVDRDTASRLGVSMVAIDSTLNDAFGQRQVSNIYKGLNQYHVVLDVAPQYQENPDALKLIYVQSKTGAMVPLSALAHYEPANTSLSVNHQGLSPSVTLSFNLAIGAPLGQAVTDITRAEEQIHMPPTVQGKFQGTAQAFQDSASSEPILIVAALGAVYIVLGILYESYIHPITILSTLPSAGVGALLAIFLFKDDLNVISIIGIILLIGIVKKNAILMIDFAISQERVEGKSPVDAIYEACLLRFRPIMMTTMAAMLGALPLAVGGGTGSELRRPLGITIVGGLIVSQMLTLFTTPVVYLYLDRFQTWLQHQFRGGVLESAHQ